MYTRGDSAFNNEAKACIGGYAVMSSERVRVADNTSKRTVEFGILLNESDKSTVENNHVTKVKNPRGKASLIPKEKASLSMEEEQISLMAIPSRNARLGLEWPWAEKERFFPATALSITVSRFAMSAPVQLNGALTE